VSRIKTITLAGILSALLASPVLATQNLAQTFAGCVGRMSAELEHAWLIGTASADRIEGQRLTFLSLLDATLPPGMEGDALNRRIEAKLAHASLLTIATFSDHKARAAQARLRANWHLSQCNEMLLDS